MAHDSDPSAASSDWPLTLAAAVERLVTELSDDDQAFIRAMSEGELYQLHFSWGMGIRNGFGLWGGNQALLESCGCWSADSASMVIIKAVWQRLQQEAG